jgi:two-component system LytT family response regulator
MCAVLIVNSRPSARDHIRRLLQEETDMTMAGQCSDGITAALSVKELSHDLVILDVE